MTCNTRVADRAGIIHAFESCQSDGPTSMSNSPMRASKLTSLRTSVRVSPAPNPLHTVFVLTAILFMDDFLFFVTPLCYHCWQKAKIALRYYILFLPPTLTPTLTLT